MFKNRDISKYTALIAFAVLFIALSILTDSFLTKDNLLQVLRQISINGLIAGGMTFVILTGGIDLSVGSILGFSSMATVLMINSSIPLPIAILLGLVIGGLAGVFNGFFIAKAKLQPFIVTLASMTILRGLTLVISGNKPVSVEASSELFAKIGQGHFLSIPIPVIILLIVYIIFWIILEKTKFGKKVYSIGGNEEVARLSGIKTDRVKIIIYALIGITCALSGIILASRLGSAQPLLGNGFELDAIAAVVIGGTSLVGGKGKISGTFIGVLIIGVLGNGLNLMQVQSDYQNIVKGAVILLAVLMDRLKKE
ncbi:ribose transport system permease protein [Bacilli bacterium PM5-3]|nr:ribose transport system permease protein [Bacilli bacterium PM5-3]MDH6604288.1 ribose transport system permease protein [Bacilli bacterium PM5-9]